MPYQADFQVTADTPEELERAIQDIADVAKAAVRDKASALKPDETYSSQAVFRLRYVEPGTKP